MTRAMATVYVYVVLASSTTACTGEISSLAARDSGRDASGSDGTGGTTAAGGTTATGGRTATGGTAPEDGGLDSSAGTGGRITVPADGGLGGPVCPGTAPPPSGYPTCRVATECPLGSTGCDFAPAVACGACVPPPDSECETDAACGAGRICESYSLQVSCLCAPPPSPLKHCVPSCATAGCPTGIACGATGRCLPKRCDAGYRCPEAYACAPARAGADAHGCAPADCNVDAYDCPDGFRCMPGQRCVPLTCGPDYRCSPNLDCKPTSTAPHGCVRRACTADAECDCGACINGLCQDRLFVCSRGAP